MKLNAILNSNHLRPNIMLTNNAGEYHERIEYLPYGEVWMKDAANSSGYSTPYKFTSKELDKETGLYYFGARYYDARISRWISTDPALQEGKYFPKPNDYDTEHDFYWYLQQEGSRKLPGLGVVFNAVNMDVYHYAGQNPVKLVDPDGNQSLNPLDLGFTNPFSFVLQVFGDRAKALSDTAHYNNPGLYSVEAFHSGVSAGMLNVLTGLDVFNANDYSVFGVAAEAKGAFAKGFAVGNVGINAVLYTNIARTVLQKTGQNIGKEFFKEVFSSKENFMAFMKGFLKATGQGALPSFTKTEVGNSFEKAGYIMGILISERAKYLANEKIK